MTDHTPRHHRAAGLRGGRATGGSPGGGWLGAAAVYGGAALLGAYMFQKRARSNAESEHPPVGRFLEVDGTVLHYVDIGSGPPIVLIHGAGSTLEDWLQSGVADHLLAHHRLIMVDRPGYGYSARPKSIRWTPERQGRAIAFLMHRLGAHGATLVAHADGVLPALSIAHDHPALARALVLIAGVYYPGAAHAGATSRVPELPLIGPLARVTVAPSLARSALPAVIRTAFEPQPVPKRFFDEFPAGLVTRSSQLEASAEDGEALDRMTARLAPHYGEISIPTTVVVGSGDGIFDPDRQSRRFARALGHARMINVPAAGHMVHHSAAARVSAAILDTAAPALRPPRPPAPARTAPGENAPEGDTPAGGGAGPRRTAGPSPGGTHEAGGAETGGAETGASQRARHEGPAKRSAPATKNQNRPAKRSTAKRSPTKRPPAKRGPTQRDPS